MVRLGSRFPDTVIPQWEIGNKRRFRLAQARGRGQDSGVIEGIRTLATPVGLWLTLSIVAIALFWFLGLFIKSAWIRLPLAFLILLALAGALPSSYSIPEWRWRMVMSQLNFEEIYPALVAYKNDHGNAFPERLSELVPAYISKEQLRWFFVRPRFGISSSAGLVEAKRDPAAVDWYGAFDYFGGKKGGLLLANRSPIKRNWLGIGRFKHEFRVVLTTDGAVQTLPEKEYQRRLAATP